MSGSDWQDPFAEDEAARERARRRAEREQRRREQEQQTRESLGERVRDELDGPQGPPAEPPPESPPPEPEAPAPEAPSSRSAPPREPAAAAGAPPPRRPDRSAVVHRRRLAALAGLGALIAVVAFAGALISRNGGDAEPAAAEKPRKTVSVTIPEGFDRSQIAPLAKKAGLKGNYEKATRSSKELNMKQLGASGADSLEGFLFPATYELFRRDNVKELVKKQLEAFKDSFGGVNLSFAEKQNLTPYDVVTIASMIEREIQVPEERKLAASVIYNRLEANDTLGIDATIRFEDSNYDKALLQSRLNQDTPYNTRVNPGLPPGPIGNPGLASLEAAANPAKTDFYFFVVKPGTCNEHTFVETEEEFAAAEADYQAALQAEGGSPTEC